MLHIQIQSDQLHLTRSGPAIRTRYPDPDAEPDHLMLTLCRSVPWHVENCFFLNLAKKSVISLFTKHEKKRKTDFDLSILLGREGLRRRK